jgi:amidase
MSSLAEVVEWNRVHNDTTGALGNNTWWSNVTSGQNFYEDGVSTNGTLGPAFWQSFGWGRFTARQAIDNAHAYTFDNGTIVALDGLLVPNGRDGGQGDACAAVPSYAGYPAAQVPIGLDGYSTPYGLCIYGQQYGEAKLVRVASAMEDLFRWNVKPQWFNYATAKGRKDSSWPGYTCSKSSLDRFSCEV